MDDTEHQPSAAYSRNGLRNPPEIEDHIPPPELGKLSKQKPISRALYEKRMRTTGPSVPVPTKYRLHEMRVGDSIMFPLPKEATARHNAVNRIRNAVTLYNTTYYDRNYITRIVTEDGVDGLRIWRVVASYSGE